MEENQFIKRQRDNKEPLAFKLHKGVKGNWGALRIRLVKPYTHPDTYNPKRFSGVIFLEMAPANGPNNYDWDNNKITIALSVTDISKIIMYLRAPTHQMFSKKGKLSIYHDPGAGTNDRGKVTKTLEINKDPDKTNFFVAAYQNSGNEKREAVCPVSPDEAISLGTLLQAAIPQILAWT
jgi:hypothetical protein